MIRPVVQRANISGQGNLVKIIFYKGYTSGIQEHAKHSKSGLLGPAVRNIIQQYKLQIDDIDGTGPKGSILKGDVLSFVKKQNLKPIAQSAPPPSQPSSKVKPAAAVGTPGPKNSRGQIKYYDIPLSGKVKDAALETARGKLSVPHGYLYQNCGVEEALKLFSGKKGMENVTLTDIVVRAVISSMQAVPTVNVTLKGQNTSRHFDVAVQSLKQKNMDFRILRKANSLSVPEIAKQRSESPVEDISSVQQVPFRAVSLIGSRLELITEILSSHQSWVISVGDILTRIDAETKTASKIANLSFAYNAAIISEENAGKFMAELKRRIERPVFILLGGSRKDTEKQE